MEEGVVEIRIGEDVIIPRMPARRAPLRVPLPAAAPRLAVLRTAYLLIPQASVLVGSEKGVPFLELRPRPGVDASGLPDEARAVFAGQLARVVPGAPAVRAELTSRMLALAGRAAARPQASGGLPPEDAARVKSLLAESGDWEKDPRGIKTAWSDLRKPK